MPSSNSRVDKISFKKMKKREEIIYQLGTITE